MYTKRQYVGPRTIVPLVWSNIVKEDRDGCEKHLGKYTWFGRSKAGM